MIDEERLRKVKLGIVLLAEGRLTEQKIAERCGVHWKTVQAWKVHPKIKSKIDTLIRRFAKQAENRAIARVGERIDRLNEDWFKVRQFAEERGADPTMAHIPGGTTGLVSRTFRSIGSGDRAREVEEYELDTGMLDKLEAMEILAAKQLGQWVDKSEARTEGASITLVEVRHPTADQPALLDAPEQPALEPPIKE